MAEKRRGRGPARPDPDVADPDFQRRWLERQLDEAQVELAWRHGFEARERFADRPFREVDRYLRHSWEAMATGLSWDRVVDIVAGGYERHKGAGFAITDPAPEALQNFERFTAGRRPAGPGERPDGGLDE